MVKKESKGKKGKGSKDLAVTVSPGKRVGRVSKKRRILKGGKTTPQVTSQTEPELPKKPDRERPRRTSKAAKEIEFSVPEDCIEAPHGLPRNLVYSKAYTMSKKQEGTVKADWGVPIPLRSSCLYT